MTQVIHERGVPDAIRERCRKADHLAEIDRSREAIPVLLEALALDTGSCDVLCRLALCYITIEEFHRGLEYANLAVGADPEDEWGHRLRSIALLRIARMCENPAVGRDKQLQAFRAASEAVRLAPDEPLTLYALLKTQLALEMMDSAWLVAERLRQVSPESELPYEAMGLLALRMEEWDSAEFYFGKILSLTPESYPAAANLGLAQLRQEKHRDALISFYNALKMNPSSEFAQEHLDLAAGAYLDDPRWIGIKLVYRMRRDGIPKDLGNYIRRKSGKAPVRTRSVSSSVERPAVQLRKIATAISLAVAGIWSAVVSFPLIAGVLGKSDERTAALWVVTVLVWLPWIACLIWRRRWP